MKTTKITIKPTDKRNEMHFEVQRRTRMQIHKNRKAYDRKAFKLKDYTE